MAKILIVEDDPKMQTGLKDNFEFEGYQVQLASDGKAALELWLEGAFDCIILDVMLPELSGFEVLKKARERGMATPVIMLTAKGEEIDRVLGLELGADDYVTKPFSLRELLARVKAVLRRSEGTTLSSSKLHLGDFEADFSSYNASRSGAPVAMTPKEFDVLKFLFEHRNRTVSRDQLLSSVWGYDESISTRTVDNFILKLRQKIEVNPSEPKHILTIHGTGYKLIL
ncbi:MAG TPA: response regulator transcription factor [Bacteroidota bacterium]|nr:response regulator transcription factor [Bacteroidota bacterium]